jgi:hypothetical protein
MIRGWSVQNRLAALIVGTTFVSVLLAILASGLALNRTLERLGKEDL